MDKKAFRYFYILLIFLIVININIISAGEIDQDIDTASQIVLSDDAGIEEVPDGGDSGTNNMEADDNSEGDSTEPTPTEEVTQGNDNNANPTSTVSNATKTPALKKSYLSTSNYVIKSKYLKVSLKDSSKKAIAKQKIILKINGKNLTATTNSEGIAKFKINEAGKTYKITLKFNGNSVYNATSKTIKIRVIAKPVYTKITLAEKGIIANDTLKVYLKTKAGKAISKQSLLITIDGKTYNRTTNAKGLVKLKLNKKSKIYNLTVKYVGKGNYVPVTRKTKINVLNSKIIGKTSYGKVIFLSVIGNRSSKVRIAYVVGLHPREHQIHDSVYKIMKNKVNMKYKYYIYRIVLTKKSGDYSVDRMRGQKLAKKYIVPHAKKQKFDCVIDIHSTTGTSYAKTYFIHVPKNKHAPSMKLAKKTIKTIKSIEKNSKMVYWSPQSQTSPPYIHLPLIEAGTPTFVFETWTYEKKSQTDKRAKILTTAVDKIFG